jgi:hypothetical protein
MAQTVDYYYNQIIQYKQSLAALAGLTPTYVILPNAITPYQKLMDDINSGSKVGRWRLFIWIIAAGFWWLATMWDNTITEMNAIAAASEEATLPWYAAVSKAFQYGFNFVVNADYSDGYLDTTSDAAIAARIITQAVAQEVNTNDFSGVIIKVATGAIGALAPLSGPQMVSFTTYIDNRKPPGVDTTIISEAGDMVKTNETIYYDGALDLPTFQAAILAARNNLLQSNIQFNGLLYLNGITNRGIITPGWVDSLTAVPGCLGVEVNSLQAKAATDIVWTNVLFTYSPSSGYYIFDAADSNITWIPV